MNELRMILALARRRLEMGRLLSIASVVGIFLFSLALALVIADRIPGASFMPWMWLLPALFMAGSAACFVLWLRQRPDEMHVAIVVDDRLDLREKISSALCCARRDDAFAQAAVADAVSVARDGKTRELVRRRIPITPPPRWWVAPLLAVVAVGVWMLPQGDLFAKDIENDPEYKSAVKDADESIDVIIKAIEEQPQLSQELKEVLDEMARTSNLDAPRTPEQVRRDAIKKVTDLNRKLNELVSGEKGMANREVERAMRQMQPTDGPAKELLDSMAKADFKGAQEALKDLMDKFEKGELNEEQREQIAQALQQAAQQLEQIMQNQDQLAQALQNAGLNPQLVNNPQALQQAIQNNPNLNEQQKQQLQQMVQAQQQAQQMCQGVGEALGQMAQAMQQGQQGQGAGQLQDQLNQLEMAQMMLQQAQAAANACQGQCEGLGQGLGMQNALQQWAQQQQQQGGGMGQRGQGAGGIAPKSQAPFGTKLEQATSKQVGDDVIARQLIDGPLVVGESKARLEAVAALIEDTYEDAVSEEQLPPKYFDINQVYFGELRKLTEAKVKQAADEASGSTTSSGSQQPAAGGSTESKP